MTPGSVVGGPATAMVGLVVLVVFVLHVAEAVDAAPVGQAIGPVWKMERERERYEIRW